MVLILKEVANIGPSKSIVLLKLPLDRNRNSQEHLTRYSVSCVYGSSCTSGQFLSDITDDSGLKDSPPPQVFPSRMKIVASTQILQQASPLAIYGLMESLRLFLLTYIEGLT